jgi:hypothetical protein
MRRWRCFWSSTTSWTPGSLTTSRSSSSSRLLLTPLSLTAAAATVAALVGVGRRKSRPLCLVCARVLSLPPCSSSPRSFENENQNLDTLVSSHKIKCFNKLTQTKHFSERKWALTRQISKNNIFNLQDFNNGFQLPGKDSSIFLVLYLICSQIWLNLLVNDCQFGYITKLKKRTLVLFTPFPLSIFVRNS